MIYTAKIEEARKTQGGLPQECCAVLLCTFASKVANNASVRCHHQKHCKAVFIDAKAWNAAKEECYR